MNCWKTINIKKEFGTNRVYLASFLIGLISFIVMFVPFSIFHHTASINDFGVLPLILAIVMLPTLHSFMHILPLIVMNKRAKLIYKSKNKLVPVFYYYTKAHLSKNASLLVAVAPTILITIPGIIATYLFPSIYVYILIFTAFHIGITFIDFLYIIHITKAPKKSVIENGSNGFDILVKAQK
ncbi:DUF3267 domain-containing protein [Virgibacillus byunsanensis]|uniref:DUF3267 domain-containing protein n=1 Tax=Virgibacillus byunsanensis TaxID=570945 RepID=A0ABW3LGY3_9BACI